MLCAPAVGRTKCGLLTFLIPFPLHRKDLGTEHCVFMLSGPHEVFEVLSPVIMSAALPQYAGAAIGASATLDTALLTVFFSTYYSYMNAMAILESEGMPINSIFDFLHQASASKDNLKPKD